MPGYYRWFRAELESLCSIVPAFLSPVARNSGRASLLLQSIEEQLERTSQLNYNSCYKAATALVPKIDTNSCIANNWGQSFRQS
ncbi:hypothetical protein C7B67_01905 [filamentous cyanobacterium Phorm 6]|nr:hypothetical protein C7B67_01905 [filamentous cyanobacterium Phorm 6]